MQEEWKDIIGYEGRYQISNLGNARSIDRVVFNKGLNKNVRMPGKTLKTMTSNSGYLQVNLYDSEAKRKMQYSHRLVAIHFLPNPENRKEVNHITGDKSNNSANNLEWVDSKGNMKHAYEQKLTDFGRRKVMCYNDEGFEKIFDSIKLAAEWVTEQRGSKASEGLISSVASGKYVGRKTAYSYKWKDVFEE